MQCCRFDEVSFFSCFYLLSLIFFKIFLLLTASQVIRSVNEYICVCVCVCVCTVQHLQYVWLILVPCEITRMRVSLWGGRNMALEGTKISLGVKKRRSSSSWVTLETRLSSTALKMYLSKTQHSVPHLSHFRVFFFVIVIYFKLFCCVYVVYCSVWSVFTTKDINQNIQFGVQDIPNHFLTAQNNIQCLFQMV